MNATPTPDTLNYLLLGLAAAIILYGILVLSLVIRRRSLEKDMDAIRQLEDEPG